MVTTPIPPGPTSPSEPEDTVEVGTEFTRLSVPVARKILEDAGFEMYADVYFQRDKKCACAIGTYVIGKLGTEGAATLDDEYGIDSDLALDLGVSQDYLTGLEVGFEDWRTDAFHDAEKTEDFLNGVSDGQELRAAVARGDIPGDIRTEPQRRGITPHGI